MTFHSDAQVQGTDETYSSDPTGLERCRPTELVALADGETFDLRIAAVANEIDGRTVRMLAYNGSIPGPTLRVAQGSEVIVRLRNDADHEATVHWHGLRLENKYDGVPHETQTPVPVGGEFTYKLQFPDDGVYWYHPHVREDYGIELGLYGNIIVDPRDQAAWPPANREAVVTLDDVLLGEGGIAPFRISGPTHTAMGRFGNVMLTAGTTEFRLDARVGEVTRFFLTNTANTRIFNVTIPGTKMKRIGGDSGLYERQEMVGAVLLGPSERAIVDVLFEQPGEFPLEHRTPTTTYVLGAITVAGDGADESFVREFGALRSNPQLEEERARLQTDLERPPDKTLVFDARMPLLYGGETASAGATWVCPMHPEVVRSEPGACPKCGMKLVPMEGDAAATGTAETRADEHEHEHMHDTGDGLEWEDEMPDINAQTDSSNMIWKLVDPETGGENQQIDWSFRVGDRVKIRLVNTMDSDHPMHHPFHIHGAGRFLVLSRDDVPEGNLVWKDTVLVRAGETVDILFDVTNQGLWMAHCHIAEHNQDGMMFSFVVTAA